MSDFLSNLADRTLGLLPVAQPVIASRFASTLNTEGSSLTELVTEDTPSRDSDPDLLDSVEESSNAPTSQEPTTQTYLHPTEPEYLVDETHDYDTPLQGSVRTDIHSESASSEQDSASYVEPPSVDMPTHQPVRPGTRTESASSVQKGPEHTGPLPVDDVLDRGPQLSLETLKPGTVIEESRGSDDVTEPPTIDPPSFVEMAPELPEDADWQSAQDLRELSPPRDANPAVVTEPAMRERDGPEELSSPPSEEWDRTVSIPEHAYRRSTDGRAEPAATTQRVSPPDTRPNPAAEKEQGRQVEDSTTAPDSAHKVASDTQLQTPSVSAQSIQSADHIDSDTGIFWKRREEDITIEEPSIKVNIGRVEVKAASPPTPAKQKQPPASNSSIFTLDDYLRKRNGGRR